MAVTHSVTEVYRASVMHIQQRSRSTGSRGGPPRLDREYRGRTNGAIAVKSDTQSLAMRPA